MITINGTEVVLEKFPNGETKIELKELVNETIRTYKIKWKYESDADFVTLRFITDYLRDTERKIGEAFSTFDIDVHIMYMPYSRMDRSENGSVFTLNSAIDMLTAMWVDNWFVYEPHSDVTALKFGEDDPWYHEVNVTDKLLEKAIKERIDKSIPYVVFYPDKGAKARYNTGSHFYLTGAKTRDFETGRIKSYEVEDADKVKKGSPFEVIIVDDLCSYGGTFIKASEALKELGAKHVTLVVAHAEKAIKKGDLFDHVDKVYTTNSIISHNYLYTKSDAFTPVTKKELPIHITKII